MAEQDTPVPLSIIVPVLNEAELLPNLFAELERQEGVAFELILSDGGSTDETLRAAGRLAETAAFPCRVVCGPAGRGRQLNAGARASQGKTFLFLHVDSVFTETKALSHGMAALEKEIQSAGHDRVAGHFALRFKRRDAVPSLAYYYYEVKACQGRPGCIHGDQGFLLGRDFFRQVGPFDESLGYLEDDRLAGEIFRRGHWILLPAVLQTSARRFEEEGFYPRQVLNALIIALETAGRSDFLQVLPALYRQQRAAGRLQLAPFFKEIRRRVAALPKRERRQFWRSAGRLAARNQWQVFLFLDARRGYRKGMAQEQVPCRLLNWYEKRLKSLVENPLGYKIAILPAWLWFHKH